MFTDHGTFIIALSASKGHISVSPEAFTVNHFSDDIKQAGYAHTKMLFRIPWKDNVDYRLLEKMIAFNIEDKINTASFWRK